MNLIHPISSSRKIPPHLDNILDNLFYDIGDLTLPLLKSLHFSPNGLTTISLLLGILCVFFLLQQQFLFAGSLWLLSYFFDCIDGAMARRYHMGSNIGDKYDHYSDYFKAILLSFAIINYNTLPFHIILILSILLVVIFILSNVQQSAKENYCANLKNNTISNSLSWCQSLSLSDSPENELKKYRWFGTGTLALYFTHLIFLNEPYNS